MNLDRTEAVDLARKITQNSNGLPAEIDLLVCPPHVYLDAVGAELAGKRCSLGAQDAYFEPAGAFTGETSMGMLNDLGCQYVILGHSERRHVIGETDELINKKVHAALSAGLIPILCVGETLAERESDQTMDVVRSQFAGSLAGLDAEQLKGVVIAYEPVWAIGTGRTATPEQAQTVHADLRKLIASDYNQALADGMLILYGGSVKPDNAADLLSQADIDGALIGGASLDASGFLAIAQSVPVSA